MGIYDQDLSRTEANFAPMTPLSFIERAAEVYPMKLAIVHGGLRQNSSQLYSRCRQLASALKRNGIGNSDTVAVIQPNTPMVEAAGDCDEAVQDDEFADAHGLVRQTVRAMETGFDGVVRKAS
jgi:acyl-CoA synthetase (AMP-forming)/AMP-acid ligase II